MTPEDVKEECLCIVDLCIEQCEALNQEPTLFLLKKNLPTTLYSFYGFMAPVVLEYYLNIKTYIDFYNIIEKSIVLKEQDKKEDFFLEESIIEDLKQLDYSSLIQLCLT